MMFHVFTNPLILVIFILTIDYSFATNPPSTLRFVHAIWRHGDRSPTRAFTTDDRNQESSWPQGFGELSKIGIQQQYALGEWLRQRYNGFISDKYSKYEVYYRSTDYNRTLMSAQANAAGMFPPKGVQVWNESVKWQPLPIHTMPKEIDYLLWHDLSCPKHAQILHEIFQQPENLQIAEENAEFFQFISDKSGMNVDFENIYKVANAIYVQNVHNNDTIGDPRLPDWATPDVRQKLMDLHSISYGLQFYSEDLLRFRGGWFSGILTLLGPLLLEMIERMEQRTQQTDQRLKFYAYSGHDSSVANVLGALGVYNSDIAVPPYCSTVLVELHATEQGQWLVKVLYRNSTSEPPHLLSISDCPNPCKLSDLRARSEPLYIEDWQYECGLVTFYDRNGLIFFILFVLMSVVAAVSVSALLFVVCKHQSSHGYTQFPLDTATRTRGRLTDEASSLNESQRFWSSYE